MWVLIMKLNSVMPRSVMQKSCTKKVHRNPDVVSQQGKRYVVESTADRNNESHQPGYSFSRSKIFYSDRCHKLSLIECILAVFDFWQEVTAKHAHSLSDIVNTGFTRIDSRSLSARQSH